MTLTFTKRFLDDRDDICRDDLLGPPIVGSAAYVCRHSRERGNPVQEPHTHAMLDTPNRRRFA